MHSKRVVREGVRAAGRSTEFVWVVGPTARATHAKSVEAPILLGLSAADDGNHRSQHDTEAGGPMQTTIQIHVTAFGCNVTVGQKTQRFTEVEQAVAYTRSRLEAAARLQDISRRCE